MTKLEVVELLLAFGPGILAFVVYGWFLWLFLFRKPDIRTLGIRIRRRLFLAAAFWPFAAFLPGAVILLFFSLGVLFPFALSMLVSYLVGMLVLLPWYPRLPFIGRSFNDREDCVSSLRLFLPAAVIASSVVWMIACFAISGGRLGDHFMENGARSIEKTFPRFTSAMGVSGYPEVIILYPEYPLHSFCILCHLEQCFKQIEMRSKWCNVPREDSWNEQQSGDRAAMNADACNGQQLRGE